MYIRTREARVKISGSATIEHAYLYHMQEANCLFYRSADFKRSTFEAGFDHRRYLVSPGTTSGAARLNISLGQVRLTNGAPPPNTAYIYEDRLSISILGIGWSIPTGGRFVDPIYRGECGPPAVGGSQQSASVSFELYIDAEERMHPNDEYLNVGGAPADHDFSECMQANISYLVPGTCTFTLEPKLGGKVGGKVIYNGVTYSHEITITTANIEFYLQSVLSPYVASVAEVHNKHSRHIYPWPPASLFPPDAELHFPEATCTHSSVFSIGGGTFSTLAASYTSPNGSQLSSNTLRVAAVEVAVFQPYGLDIILPGEYAGAGVCVYLLRPRQEIETVATLFDGAGRPLPYLPGADWTLELQNAGVRPPIVSQEFAAPGGSGSVVHVRENRNVSGTVKEGSNGNLYYSTNPTYPTVPGPFVDYPAVVIKKSSFTAAGYTVTQPWYRRLTLRGRSWPTRRIGHFARLSYGRDNPTDETPGGWNLDKVLITGSVTKSISGGKLRIETAAGFAGGKAFEIVSDAIRAEYRFYKLRYRRVDGNTGEMEMRRGIIAVNSTPALLRFPAAAVAGDWVEVEDRDLLAPESPTPPLPDAVAGSTSPGSAPNDTEIQIHLPAGAGIWEIDYIEGYRRSTAHYSYLCAPVGHSGEPLALCVDGMSLIDYSGEAFRRTSIAPTPGKPWTGRPWNWGGYLGSGTYPLEYWESSDSEAWEGGHGLYRSGGGLQFSALLSAGAEDDPADDPRIMNTEVYDACWLYPGCGDVFGGQFGERTTLYFGQILSPSVRGVLNTDGDTSPAVGVFTAPGGTQEGEASPANFPGNEFPEGYFVIEGRLSFGDKTERLIPESDPADRATFSVGQGIGKYKPRGVLYLLLRENEAGQGISSDLSPTGRIVAADTGGGKVRLNFASVAARLPGGGPGGSSAWLRVETSIEGTRPAVIYGMTDARIWIAWEDGEEIKRGYTDDEGKTVSGVTAIFTGTGYSRPAVCRTATEIFHYFALQDPGGGSPRVIRAKAYDRAGNALPIGPGGATEWSIAAATNVSDDDLTAICPDGGEIVLIYRDATSGSMLSIVSTDGVTFS